MDAVKHVLNLGAGVQSTTLYLLPIFGEGEEMESLFDFGLDFGEPPAPLPWYDAAVFADTGDEPSDVYRHLRWMIGLRGPEIVIANVGCGVIPQPAFLEFVDRIDADGRRAASEWFRETVRGFLPLSDCLKKGVNSTGQRFVAIPAFTSATEGGPGGITQRQCTSEFKVKVVEQTIRRHVLGLAPGRSAPANAVVQYFGLSRDEPARVAKVSARFRAKHWTKARFPLYERCVERTDCRKWLEPRVPHRVPRSACAYCPYRDNAGWRHQRDTDPDSWGLSVEVDEAIRDWDATVGRTVGRLYLHESCLPIVSAPLGEPDRPRGFEVECEGMCGL